MKTFFKLPIYANSILVYLFAISLFFITRLTNLKILPIFTDEAIYSYWAQVALHDPENRYISLIDGKQPLFIWLGAISQNFIKDPLIATRLVSVIAGFLALIGIYFLTLELFNKKTALVAAMFYIVLPFTLFYDRIALFDSLLTMIGIFAVFLSVKLAKKPGLDLAILNGIAIGLGQITKSSAIFFLYLLPFSLIFLNLKEKALRLKVVKLFAYFSIVFLISFTIYNSLRLSPLFYIIDRKNMEFVWSFSELAKNPFLSFHSNFFAIISWIISYIGHPLFAIFVLGGAYGLYKRNKQIIYLLVLVLVPFLAECFFNKVLYPRFVLFYFPYIIIIISQAITTSLNLLPKYKYALIATIFAFTVGPAVNSFWLIADPLKAKLPDAETFQYRDDWPAGYGVEEVRHLIVKESQAGNIHVATEGTFGLFPFALDIYFFANDRVHISSHWPVDPLNLPQEVLDISNNTKTYFVFNFNQSNITNPRLKFVGSYKKGNGNSYMRLYEVTQ